MDAGAEIAGYDRHTPRKPRGRITTHCVMTCALVTAIGLCVAARAMSAQSDPAGKPPAPNIALSDTDVDTLLFNDPAIFSDDIARRKKNLVRIIQSDPRDVRAALAARELLKRFDTLPSPADLATPISAARAALLDTPSARYAAAILREYDILLAAAWRRAGRFDEAAAMLDADGYMRAAYVSGTFGDRFENAFEMRFAPENTLRINADDGKRQQADAPKRFRWVRAAPSRPFAPVLFYRKKPDAVIYLAAAFTSDRKSIALELSAGRPVRVWIDGKPVAEYDPYRDILPAPLRFLITLKEVPDGVHVMLVKTAAARPPADDELPRFILRLAQPDGMPLQRGAFLPASALSSLNMPIENQPAAFGESRAALKMYRDSTARAMTEWLAAFSSENPPAYHLVFPAVCLMRYDPDTMLEAFSRLDSLSPSGAFLMNRARLRLEYDAARMQPYVRDRDALARLILNRFTGADAESPLVLRLKSALATTPRQRIELAERSLAAQRKDANLSGLMALYDAYVYAMKTTGDLQWREAGRKVLDEALKRYDGYVRPMNAAVSDEMDVFMPMHQLDIARRLMRINPDNPSVVVSAAKWYFQGGRFDSALDTLATIMPHYPDDDNVLQIQTRCLSARFFSMLSSGGTGNIKQLKKDAVSAWQHRIDVAPDDAGAYIGLGDFYRRLDMNRNAVETYRRLLAVKPYRSDIRSLVERLEGVKPFYTPYDFDEVKMFSLLDAARNADHESFPSVRVIDHAITRLFEDGSSETADHTLRLAVTLDGVTDISMVNIRGDLPVLRTILPDNTQRFPTLVPGRSRAAMPEVNVGSAVEVKRVWTAGARRDGMRYGPWYFSSPDFDDMFFLSELVLMLPESCANRVSIVTRNFSTNTSAWNYVREQSWTQDGWIIRRWTADRRDPVARESRMPHISDILPNVEVVPVADTRDIGLYYRKYLAGRIHASWAIRSRAAKITKGLGTDREKAIAIYEFVQHRVRTFQPGLTAHDTLESSAGNRTLLLLAMLRAAGLDPMYVRTRLNPDTSSEPLPADSHALTARDYTEELVQLELPSGALWLDTYNRNLRPMMLGVRGNGDELESLCAARIDSMDGVAISPDSGGVIRPVTLPAPPDDLMTPVDRRLDIVLKPNGSAVITGYWRSTGAFACALRQRAANRSGRERRELLEKTLARTLPGADLLDADFGDLNRLSATFAVSFSADDPDMIHFDQTAIAALPNGLARVGFHDRFARESSRRFDLVIHEGWKRTATTRYTLPNNLTVTQLPENIVESGGLLSYSLSWTRTDDGHGVVIARVIELRPGRIPPENYLAFRGMLRRIDRAEKQTLNVTRTK